MRAPMWNSLLKIRYSRKVGTGTLYYLTDETGDHLGGNIERINVKLESVNAGNKENSKGRWNRWVNYSGLWSHFYNACVTNGIKLKGNL